MAANMYRVGGEYPGRKTLRPGPRRLYPQARVSHIWGRMGRGTDRNRNRELWFRGGDAAGRRVYRRGLPASVTVH